MIRITIKKKQKYLGNGIWKPEDIIVKAFNDEALARKWLIEDSYFSEPYVESILWERV